MKTALIIEDIAETSEWLAEVLTRAFPACQTRRCANLSAARKTLEQFDPDIALIDLALPDGSGLEILRQLVANHCSTLRVVTTISSDDNSIVSALAAGAHGYLLKHHRAGMLAQQLVQLASGIPPLSPEIARRMMVHYSRTGPSGIEGTLTLREQEVLQWISHGLPNPEIAEHMGIAVSTVATHVKAIYRKLNISSRAEAGWHAIRMGL